MPLSVFGANIVKAHYCDAVEEIKSRQSFFKCTGKMILFASGLAIVMVAVLMIASPTLFQIIYGAKWRTAGEYVQILAPMFGLRMIVDAVVFSFIIANKQKIELLYQILLLVSFFVLYSIVSYLQLDMKTFLVLLSGVYSIIFFSELISMVCVSKKTNYEKPSLKKKALVN